MPAVSPGTTTGSEIVLFLRTGFFRLSLSSMPLEVQVACGWCVGNVSEELR